MKRKMQAPLPARAIITSSDCILIDMKYPYKLLLVVQPMGFAALPHYQARLEPSASDPVVPLYARKKDEARKKMKQMRRTLLLASTMLFLSGLLPAPAFAKDMAQQAAGSQSAAPTVPKSDEVPNTGGVSPENDMTGSISRDDAMSTLLSAIAGAHSSATALGAMRTVSAIRVVPLKDIAKGDDRRTVAGAMKDYSADRKALQSAIRSNAVLAERLEAKRTKPSQVVAAKIEADGSVTFFAD